MRHPAMLAGAFVGAFLVLIPLPALRRFQSVALFALAFWLFATNIIFAVDALVWAGSDAVRIPVWCDITTKLVLGSTFALPAAALCVCKHLESAAAGRAKYMSDADHRRRKIFESVLCFGGPALFMLFHCIVQDHRFDIVEDIGCRPAIYTSVPALLLVWVPPLLLSAVALIYAAVALHHFLRKRLLFEAHAQGASAAVSTHQYLIVLAMAVTEAVWGAAFTVLQLSADATAGLRPWDNWTDVHADWQRVERRALDQLSPSAGRELFVLWWSVPAAALIFFVYFALTDELRDSYGRLLSWVLRRTTKRTARSSAVLDLWPDAEGGTKRIIIHKESRVDVYKDGASLPPYSPAGTTHASFYTADDAISKADLSAPPTPTPAPSTVTVWPSHRSSVHGSDRSSWTSFSMSILHQYPVSAPPSPPALERPPGRNEEGSVVRGPSPSGGTSLRGEGPRTVQDAVRMVTESDIV